jgi:hypothetical protein
LGFGIASCSKLGVLNLGVVGRSFTKAAKKLINNDIKISTVILLLLDMLLHKLSQLQMLQGKGIQFFFEVSIVNGNLHGLLDKEDGGNNRNKRQTQQHFCFSPSHVLKEL